MGDSSTSQGFGALDPRLGSKRIRPRIDEPVRKIERDAGVGNPIPGVVGDDPTRNRGLRPRSGKRRNDQSNRQNRVLHRGSDEPDCGLDDRILTQLRQPAASFPGRIFERSCRSAAGTFKSSGASVS